jgi:LacI family transcriptional regulator
VAEVGIRDVAAYAGVSVSTASNAVNKPELVSKAAAAKVAEAVAALGYVPNVAARQLRAGRSNAIGMAVINIANPFFSEVVLGAEDAAELADYSVIVGNSYDSFEREARYLQLFERNRLDGVLIAPLGESLELLDRFRQRNVPVVLVDRIDPDGVFSSVSLDDSLGGRMVADHLLGSGCRHIAFIGGPSRMTQIRNRYEGCRAQVEAAGVRMTLFPTDTLNVGLGRELAHTIAALAPADRPDGIFAGNDELALGLMQGLMQLGLRVPDDISVVGYDDIDFAAAAIVPLTSIRQPSHQMGTVAAQTLLAQLDLPDRPVSQVQFTPELIVRQSTRARR